MVKKPITNPHDGLTVEQRAELGLELEPGYPDNIDASEMEELDAALLDAAGDEPLPDPIRWGLWCGLRGHERVHALGGAICGTCSKKAGR